MLIIVASANIFRRELTSYVLGEAGYRVSEARDRATLLASLSRSGPLLAVIDAQIDGGAPAGLLADIRRRSQVPLLWIAEPDAARSLLMGDEEPAAAIPWPYHPDDLLAQIGALRERLEARWASGMPRARYAGTAE